MENKYWEDRMAMSPEDVLKMLKDGNERFTSNLRINRNLLQLANDTAAKQFPLTAILSCSDSRAPIELIFDQGLGDVFSVRLAGNIASVNAIGSIEYACKYLGSKLIVVLGHTGCGAVKGACDNVQEGHIYNVIKKITPAVKFESDTKKDRTSANDKFVSNVTFLNVQMQMQIILDNSQLIRDMIKDKKVGIIGGIYDIKTGKVAYYGEDQMFNIEQEFDKFKSFHFIYE